MSGENKKVTLPTLQDLTNDTELAIKENQLNALLNAKPPVQWLSKHPFATKEVINEQGKKVKVALDFMPINRVEWLLTRLFLKWRVEVKSVQLIANSIVTTVKLHYKNPLDNEWDWQDGIGAVPIQTKKDHGAIDFQNMNTNAIQLGSPAAESYAIKDAAEKIGRLFGKDINRVDIENYTDAMQGNAERLGIIDMREKFSQALMESQDEEKNQELRDKAVDARNGGTETVELYQELIDDLKGVKK